MNTLIDVDKYRKSRQKLAQGTKVVKDNLNVFDAKQRRNLWMSCTV